jgi:hypothetical protein
MVPPLILLLSLSYRDEDSAYIEFSALHWGSRPTVAAVLEEAASLLPRDREERLSQCLEQPLSGAGLSFSQYDLDLRESLLDRIQIRRVSRQLQKLASGLFDEFGHALALMGTQVVHHYDLSDSEVSDQELLDVGLEDESVHRAFDG